MKILALTDCLTKYHSFWIRVGQYLKTLAEEYAITITHDKEYISRLKKGDKLIFYRYSLEWGNLGSDLKAARSRGVYIISDVDDYLWNDGNLRGWNKQRLKLYTDALKHCNLLTTSTQILKEQLRVMFRDIEVEIVKNTAPPLITNNKTKDDEIVRIGWTGAPWTRPYDLQQINPLGKWICDNSERVRLVHIGHSKENLTLANVLNIDERYVEKISLRDYEDYILQFNFDIGIAPLQETCFNSFKSAIKVVEYSANGIPWVASDVSVYRNLCQEWSWDGRLCSKKDDWIKNIKELLSKEKRVCEGRMLKMKCEEHSSNSQGVKDWKRIINKGK